MSRFQHSTLADFEARRAEEAEAKRVTRKAIRVFSVVWAFILALFALALAT